MKPQDNFSGIIIEVHTPRPQGIYSPEALQAPILKSVGTFYANRGVHTAEGCRPGIGAAATGGVSEIEELIRAIPVVGKLIMASWKMTKLISTKTVEYRKRKMRPFRPSVGIHLDIWPTTEVRSRGNWASLMEVLETLPSLIDEIQIRHPGVTVSILVTQNDRLQHMPALRIDGNACSDRSMFSLILKVKKDQKLALSPTHYWLSRSWGLRNKATSYSNKADAFYFVHLFPQNQYSPT